MSKIKVPKIQFVPCHRLPERSFFFRGKQFPVCARCTGILIGYLSFPLIFSDIINIDFVSTILLNIPALIDGYTQALKMRESTNGLRLFTGILSGIGQISLVNIIGHYLDLIIKTVMEGVF